MLQSIKQLCGSTLVASDGDLGHVKDFYFDDRNWTMQYLVVDTGSGLPWRQVPMTPDIMKGVSPAKGVLMIRLTRMQIERSPAIGPHRPGRRIPPIGPQLASGDGHLCSAQAVNGYHLKTGDGIAGFVTDFMMDDASWTVSELVIQTGHRFSGKEVRIPAGQVNRISYEESTVFVDLTSAQVEKNSARDLVAMA